ncbi:MAG: hypothetical protein L0H24_13100 [Microlunatus sp.]|nr:hypothetical protein [Microlunatus sp.]
MINPAEGGDFHLAKTGDFGVAVDNDPDDPYPGSASAPDYITPDTSPDRATREVLTVQTGRCYETPEGLVVCYASGPADEEDAIDAEVDAALERWRREHVSGEDPSS